MKQQQQESTNKNKEVTQELTPMPAEWPGAFGLFKYSKAAIGFNVWTIVFLYLLMIAVAVFFEAVFHTSSSKSIFANIVNNIVMGIVSTAFAGVTLSGISRKKVSFSESFTQLQPMVYVNAFVSSILVGIIAVISLAALILPFFFIMPRLMLCEYYIIEKGMGPIDSIKASWHASKGNLGKVYGIYGVTLLFALIIITIIGIPVAAYLLAAYSAAFALLYKFLDKNQPEEVGENE